MKTKTQTKNKGIKLQDYFDSLDLYSWWEDFSNTYADNGLRKYTTVHAFIKHKTKDEYKRKFLWWILGPTAETPRNPEFAKFKQFDWETKRGKDFWCSSKEIKDIEYEIKHRMSSVDEVKATGAFNIEEMRRNQILIEQLDSEFGGRLQLPNLSAKENDIRLRNYFGLREKLQAALHQAQMMFAKTRNIDFAALAEMLAVVGPSMIGQMSSEQQVDEATQRKLDGFNNVTQMLLTKSSQWGIKLPDADIEKVVKQAGKPVTIDRKKVQ